MRQTISFSQFAFSQKRATEHPADVPAPASRQPARSQAIDFMRAVAIMLVVFGHAQRGLYQTGQIAGFYWDTIYPVVDYYIYVFHIPVFFATSGILLGRQSQQSPRQFALRMGRLA